MALHTMRLSPASIGQIDVGNLNLADLAGPCIASLGIRSSIMACVSKREERSQVCLTSPSTCLIVDRSRTMTQDQCPISLASINAAMNRGSTLEQIL
jgi:hypothetical protein